MKIIKGVSALDATTITRITGEMVNTQYGMTLYKDGQYVKYNADTNVNRLDYNTYDINGVAYEVHPTRGILVIISDREPYNIKTLIEQQYNAMRDHVLMMGRVSKTPFAAKGTTQYLIIDTHKSINKVKLVFVTNREKPLIDANDEEDSGFIWYIYLTNYLAMAPINIPYFTYTNNDLCIFSLSSIIYDDKGIFALPHGYKSADYPMIYDYNIWRTGNIVEHTIDYQTLSGICIEMARHYVPTEYIRNASYKNAVSKTASNKNKAAIYWLKWQDAKIKKVLPHHVMPITDQLKCIDDVPYYDTESADASKFENYVCCMTGMPIYEDCYVVDIYESKNQDGATIEHITPTRLLLSAFYVHHYDNEELRKATLTTAGTDSNNILIFEKLTNTKCILYRTFCPVRAQDIIMGFNEDYFSPIYKKALISIDKHVTLVRRDYTMGESIDKDGHKYLIKSDFNKFESIEKNTTIVRSSTQLLSYIDEDYEGFKPKTKD